MDMPEFERVEDEEEDYNLEDFFLFILYPLQPMVDYRIKLLLKNDLEKVFLCPIVFDQGVDASLYAEIQCNIK